jgi:CMP-N-acetylneuraminic acid synthetase
LLGGQPLITWTVSAARAAQGLSRVAVSTDDDEIRAAARLAGAETPFRRPPALAGSEVGALPVIRHALEALDAEGWRADFVIYLQPTSPFRGAGAIDRAVTLIGDGSCDTVVSVVKVPHAMTPDSLMCRAGDYLEFVAPPDRRILRRQDKSELYARNGPAVLALTRATALGDSLYGKRIKALEMSRLESLDIDEPADLNLAEALVPLVRAERAAGHI